MQILYFAWLRERIGLAEQRLDLPEGVQTVGQLVAWLGAQDARHAAAFARPELIRCAVNQDFANPETPLAADDEVAFFPPVTGG